MFVKARTMKQFPFILITGILVLFLVGLLPFDALAQQANDVKGAARSIANQSKSIAPFIAVVSYVAGTFFAVRGLFALKGFIQAPDDNPVNVFIGFATVSALLIMLPYSMGLTSNTLHLQTSDNITATHSSFNGPACSGSGMNRMFCNIVKEVRPFAKLLAMIAYVMSASLVLTGLMNLKAYGDDPSQTPLRSIIMKFVLATMLISLPLAMELFVTTVTGVDSIDSKTNIRKPKAYKAGE